MATRQNIRDARLDALTGQKGADQRALTPQDIPMLVAQIERALEHRILRPGDVFFRAVTDAPRGAIPADGAEIPRREFPALFAAIGTTHGTGDGSTTFDLPAVTAPVGLTAFIKT